MKRKLLSMLLIFSLLLMPFSMGAGAVTEEENTDFYIPGAIIVVFETEPEIIEDGDYFIVEGITCSSFEPLCPSEDPDVTYLLVLPEGANSQEETETAIAILKANPNVDIAEQNFEVFIDDSFEDESEPDDAYIPGEIIVIFYTEPEVIEDGDYFIVEGITCSSFEALCPSEDPDVTYLLVLPEGANSQEETETAIAILKANPNVDIAEQNFWMDIDDEIEYIPGEIIVGFETEPEIIEDGDFFIVAGVTCASIKPVSAFEDPCLTYLLILPEGANSQEETEIAIAILKANPNVDIAEQNFWMDIDDPVAEPGDINHDGEINITDYTLAKRIVMGTYSNAVFIGNDPADVNGDGEVTANDYILIKRHVMQTYIIG